MLQCPYSITIAGRTFEIEAHGGGFIIKCYTGSLLNWSHQDSLRGCWWELYESVKQIERDANEESCRLMRALHHDATKDIK